MYLREDEVAADPLQAEIRRPKDCLEHSEHWRRICNISMDCQGKVREMWPVNATGKRSQMHSTRENAVKCKGNA